jgi:hypothetical protein
MNPSAHKLLKRFAVVGAASGFAVPVAAAAIPAPDAFQRAVSIHNAALQTDALDRNANIHNAALQTDAFDRAVNVHNAALQTDALDRNANIHNAALQTDAFDRAVNVHAAMPARSEMVRIVQSGGFDWGDAGIGAGGALGFVFLLGAAGSLVLRQKHRLSNA